MNMTEYQLGCKRTMNMSLTTEETRNHALFGLCSEVGEIHSFFQKLYQGHMIDDNKLSHEIGDAFWFLMELCTICGFDADTIAEENLEKLRERYPDGFDAEHSLYRTEEG